MIFTASTDAISFSAPRFKKLQRLEFSNITYSDEIGYLIRSLNIYIKLAVDFNMMEDIAENGKVCCILDSYGICINCNLQCVISDEILMLPAVTEMH